MPKGPIKRFRLTIPGKPTMGGTLPEILTILVLDYGITVPGIMGQSLRNLGSGQEYKLESGNPWGIISIYRWQ